MADKISLAIQIGTIQEIIATLRKKAKGNSKDAYFAEQQLRSLEATESVLTFLINNAAELKAFMAGKDGE